MARMLDLKLTKQQPHQQPSTREGYGIYFEMSQKKEADSIYKGD